MSAAMRARTRSWLLRLRIHGVPAGGHRADPNSPDYLYLVQQCKRLSLSVTVGRLRPGNLALFPVLLLIILLKAADL